jgi:lysophospholipase L1-like esterase
VHFPKFIRWGFVFLTTAGVSVPASAAPVTKRFDFGPGPVAEGWVKVDAGTTYSEERGYGFESGATIRGVDSGRDPVRGDFCTAAGPFSFSVALPEGNYDVTLLLGDPKGTSSTTVKAESRRLMLEGVSTKDGQTIERSFTVNIRTPRIDADRSVRLKDRERPYLHWDDKLTVEFLGDRPCIAAATITSATDAATVFLTGDSTVTDQPTEPWNSWGQMLPRFLKPGVAVANYAESGESIKSSLSARRFEKVFAVARAGDYLFVQFGHNDMKDKAPDALAVYKANLEKLVDRAVSVGMVPVLVTSMERKAGIEKDTLAGYPRTVRDVAKAKGVALIDLHAMSKVLYRALGADLDKAFQDGTHHNNYGSYELAKCVVEGIRENRLGLAKFIADDVAPFDPAQPDSVADFKMPASGAVSQQKPDGN